MLHPIRIGLQIQPQHATYEAQRSAAIEAEERGVDVVFNWDHFYPLSGDPDGPHFECMTQLASFAEVTSEVEIGPLVVSNSYRNPNLLADMSRTIDHMSGGRFILGIGAGWFKRDYDEYGFDFGEASDRARSLKENLPIIEERFGLLNPPPVRDVPLLVAGKGEQVMLRLVARHADIWHMFGDPETMRRKTEVLERWCDTEGRDPSEIERSSGVAAADLGDTTVGDSLVDVDVTFLTFGVSGPDYDLAFLDRWIDWRDSRNA